MSKNGKVIQRWNIVKSILCFLSPPNGSEKTFKNWPLGTACDKLGFPGVSDGKESAYIAGNQSLIPGLGKSPGERNGNPFQYSCLENSKDRGAWWTAVHGVAKSQTQLNTSTFNSLLFSWQTQGCSPYWNQPGENGWGMLYRLHSTPYSFSGITTFLLVFSCHLPCASLGSFSALWSHYV